MVCVRAGNVNTQARKWRNGGKIPYTCPQMRPSTEKPDGFIPSAVVSFLARRAHLIALALFAAAGAAVLDDYGLAGDEELQRRFGHASLDYVLGDEDALSATSDSFILPVERYYGVAFELPLAAAERILGLEDSRAVYLSRHLLMHALFLAGGFFAWLLAYRLFGNRLVALLAMLIFLLHPRLYAHSFFNTKDLPFLSAFMIALYLIHRAFRRDSLWAFALCGAGVGLLMNVRIMGALLLPAVLGLLALDAVRAAMRGDGGAKRVLANAGAFIAAFAAALYAAWPLLWRDPTNLLDAFRGLSAHPAYLYTLFRGERVIWPNIPWDYVPTWMLITSPPAALILAALGIAAAVRLCAADWRGIFADSPARFGLLAAACLVLPIAAVIALDTNLYQGWRHMYFLWAPACVLAAFGLRALADIPHPRLRTAAFGIAALGIAAAAVQIAALHPHQNDYFNPLASKDGLADRWQMNYWRAANKQALEALLELEPSGILPVNARLNVQILPAEDRRRLLYSESFPSFDFGGSGGGSVLWEREIYGVPIASVRDVRDESETAFREAYADARAAAQPDASAGGFDIYADGGFLTLIKEGCDEEEDARGTFQALIFPSNRERLPHYAGEYDSFSFDFRRYGAMMDGVCLIRAPLPKYPIHAAEVVKRADGAESSVEWRAALALAESPDAYLAALSALPPSPDASGGGFAIYADMGADGGRLIYRKRGCSDGDRGARFFLSAFPSDPDDLPQAARAAGLGHEPLNFDFHRYGAMIGGDCVIIRELPGYPIDRVETGQWIPGEGGLWSAEVLFPPRRERYAAALAALPPSPDASAGGFAIYADADGRRLIYVKRGCSDGDTRGRFFLSIFPADPDDLPQSSRAAGLGHEALNFDFPEYGAMVGGDCVIVRDLPDYPIDRIETGQWIPGEGGLWSAIIAVGG